MLFGTRYTFTYKLHIYYTSSGLVNRCYVFSLLAMEFHICSHILATHVIHGFFFLLLHLSSLRSKLCKKFLQLLYH